MNPLLSEVLFDASILFLVTGAFIALLYGLGLLFAPNATLEFNDKINRRVSLRKQTKAIETSIKTEPYFYRHARLAGSILVAGAVFVLYSLNNFNNAALIPYLPRSLSPAIWGWLLQSLTLFFYISFAFILVFGIVVLIRPSALKNFEQRANHWISTRQHFAKMSTEINVTDDLLKSYPRAFGAIIVIFSLMVLFLLLPGI